MVPLIIGGIALAATGYGIKKFLEQIAKNDTNWFSSENIEVTLLINNKAKEYFPRRFYQTKR